MELAPNVVVVSVDTLRADALGFAGHAGAETPHLDRLAERGTRFVHAIAPVPRTTPALGSLLTGTAPRTHGSFDTGDPIGDVPTLAELLRERGYRTLAVSTNESAGPDQGLARGFDLFVTQAQVEAFLGSRRVRDFGPDPPNPTGWASGTTMLAMRHVSELASEQPFFLWVFYFDPHFLYRPPPAWQEGKGGEACRDLYREWETRRRESGLVFADVGGVARAVVEDCRRLYDREVAYTDAEVGSLLEGLEQEGRLENAVVVFVADHGENFGEGGLFFEHGSNAHDAGLRIPMVFAGSGIAAGRTVELPSSLADVAPTVLELVDGEAPGRAEFDGRSLARYLRGDRDPPEAPDRILFARSSSSTYNEATHLLQTGRVLGRACLNGPRFTLCKSPVRAPGVVRMYDHEADPGLTEDVADRHPDEVVRLLEAWERWPPETARERVAWTPDFKLVDRPRLEGGYRRFLYHLPSDPGESLDVGDRFPDVRARLGAALDRWFSEPDAARRAPTPDSRVEETLRSLGYLP